jgi:hypothetical protein
MNKKTKFLLVVIFAVLLVLICNKAKKVETKETFQDTTTTQTNIDSLKTDTTK